MQREREIWQRVLPDYKVAMEPIVDSLCEEMAELGVELQSIVYKDHSAPLQCTLSFYESVYNHNYQIVVSAESLVSFSYELFDRDAKNNLRSLGEKTTWRRGFVDELKKHIKGWRKIHSTVRNFDRPNNP